MKKANMLCLAGIICMAMMAEGNGNICSAANTVQLQEAAKDYSVAEAPIIDTTSEYELLQDIVKQIRKKTDFEPKVAIILGSGLNSIAEKVTQPTTISYKDIKGLPVSSAPGHVGKFVFGYLEGVPVVIMQGRVHCYEGYSSLQVVRPVRVMKMLGAKTLVITNSSGGINKDYKGGEIMMINNQILYGVQNPLIGANINELGERFTDMGSTYNKELQELLRASAKEAGIVLKEGTYLQDSGPSYETTAETIMFRTFGADAVGMSTGIEAVAAQHMGMKICGLSCVTAAPSDASTIVLNEDVVNNQADMMTKDLGKLLTIFIKKLKE